MPYIIHTQMVNLVHPGGETSVGPAVVLGGSICTREEIDELISALMKVRPDLKPLSEHARQLLVKPPAEEVPARKRR
jgi:hypothetical protein